MGLPLLPGRTNAWLWLAYASGFSYLAYHLDPAKVPAWALYPGWGVFALLLLSDLRACWLSRPRETPPLPAAPPTGEPPTPT